MIITIDGPAGTGKTTVAREVAKTLGYRFFDTGAMYRALAYKLGRLNLSLEDHEKLLPFLETFVFDIREVSGHERYFVENEDVTDVIRSSEVTQAVSVVAAHPRVRQALVFLQRAFGKKGNAVFEGRDMGTIVFPDADLKIFLTARPAVRAERRYLELKDKTMPTTQEEVMHQLVERDHFDSTREISPLKQASDAHLIDTSDLNLQQVLKRIYALIPKKDSPH